MIQYILGKTNDSTGSFIHASDKTDVTWFPTKWKCHSDGIFEGKDAILIGIFDEDKETDAWCDWDMAKPYRFICEAIREQNSHLTTSSPTQSIL